MPEHSTITDPNVHEPKGASTATADTVYVSNGVGSGTWQKIDEGSIDPSALPLVNNFFLHGVMDDISTASTIYIPVPEDSTCVEISYTLQAAITVADSNLTFANHAGSTMDTDVVPFTGSAPGTTAQTTISSNNVFTAGQRMSIATDGGSTTVAKVFFVAKMLAS